MLKDVAPFKLDDNRLFKTGTIQVLLKPVVESEGYFASTTWNDESKF